ncbi:putative protein OS=Afipia felis OX=1035 GN=BN961_00360 PE=4 SV=1 [Afipia felis]
MEDKWPRIDQVDDFRQKQTEDEQQRAELGPRGVPGKADPAKMTPQNKKNTPENAEGGHTA